MTYEKFIKPMDEHLNLAPENMDLNEKLNLQKITK